MRRKSLPMVPVERMRETLDATTDPATRHTPLPQPLTHSGAPATASTTPACRGPPWAQPSSPCSSRMRTQRQQQPPRAWSRPRPPFPPRAAAEWSQSSALPWRPLLQIRRRPTLGSSSSACGPSWGHAPPLDHRTSHRRPTTSTGPPPRRRPHLAPLGPSTRYRPPWPRPGCCSAAGGGRAVCAR